MAAKKKENFAEKFSRENGSEEKENFTEKNLRKREWDVEVFLNENFRERAR